MINKWEKNTQIFLDSVLFVDIPFSPSNVVSILVFSFQAFLID